MPLTLVLIATICLAGGVTDSLHGQSVAELRSKYSGSTQWDANSRTLTFSRSGVIRFDKPNHKNHFWDVPQVVSTVVIDANVTVTGAFHTRHDCTITGVDRKTSVVYGTDQQSWSHKHEVKAYRYCQFQNYGGVLTVKDLTARNPFAFFIRGWEQVCHAQSCDFIDDRGGWGNHSDGFEGGHGSTVDDCYFATGDDAIKCYFDITVTDCSIKMIQNCVPFQFGWGTYQDSTSRISNVTITGDKGRGPNLPVFHWKAGRDYKTVLIDGLRVHNPNAALFQLQSKEGRLDLTIDNAVIDVKKYGTQSFPGTRTICGATSQRSSYRCEKPRDASE